MPGQRVPRFKTQARLHREESRYITGSQVQVALTATNQDRVASDSLAINTKIFGHFGKTH